MNKLIKLIKAVGYLTINLIGFIFSTLKKLVHVLYVVLTSRVSMFLYGTILATVMIKGLPQHYPEIPKAEAPQYVQEIYYNLLRVSGMQRKIPPIYMINTPWSFYTVNAYASNDGIYLTYGMLMSVRNVDELALVIGHEMAHELAGHVTEVRDLAQQQMEAQADQLGVFLMMRAGYNICNGKGFWDRMTSIYGDEAISSHPSNTFRAWQIDMPQCHKQ